MSIRKLTAVKLDELKGPRRKKPRIRARKHEQNRIMQRDLALFRRIRSDMDIRASFLRGAGLPVDAVLVLQEIDHSYRLTETQFGSFPRWRDLTQFFKLQLGFSLGCFGEGYSFTANVHPDLEARWNAQGTHVPTQIRKRLVSQLRKLGLSSLPFAYIIEGRSKSGRSRVALHIHGFVITRDLMDITKLKIATEFALRGGSLGRVGRKTSFKHEPAYDAATDDQRGKWISYIAKNATRWDVRLKDRRVYMSPSMSTIVQGAYELVCDDGPPISLDEAADFIRRTQSP